MESSGGERCGLGVLVLLLVGGRVGGTMGLYFMRRRRRSSPIYWRVYHMKKGKSIYESIQLLLQNGLFSKQSLA